MQKEAPGWGKAIGIIMICLGSLGVFYQIYKILIPRLLKLMPNFTELPGFDEGLTRNEGVALEQINGMLNTSDAEANTMIALGYFGLVFTVFYIVAGAKLLTAKPANYNFAKYTLLGFIIYNATALLLFLGSMSSFFLGLILTYSVIGLGFDTAFIIILLASNKGAYGIGIDTSLQDYTIDTEADEIL